MKKEGTSLKERKAWKEADMDILVKENYVKKACRLHKEYPVADAHLDLAGEILIRNQKGEKNILQSYYLENWKKSGICLVMSSVYVPNRILEKEGIQGAWEDAIAQIEALKKDIEPLSEIFLVRNKEDLQRVKKKEGIGILLYMEGLDGIGEEIDRIKNLYDMGIRGASLTWSRQNALATGCCKAGEYKQIQGRLTKLGKRAVEELEKWSMFVDISHLNDEGFEDVVEIANRPLIATHSCARSIYDNYRNLTDEQMQKLAKKGGIMGLNGCKLIAGSKKGNHLEMLCRHAEYELDKLGSAGVCFGFDLCDSYDKAYYELRKMQGFTEKEPEAMDCFCDYSQIPLLTAALLQRGMEENRVIGIMGRNLLDYLEKILP